MNKRQKELIKEKEKELVYAKQYIQLLKKEIAQIKDGTHYELLKIERDD